jgi:hypothetical protein
MINTLVIRTEKSNLELVAREIALSCGYKRKSLKGCDAMGRNRGIILTDGKKEVIRVGEI